MQTKNYTKSLHAIKKKKTLNHLHKILYFLNGGRESKRLKSLNLSKTSW